MDEGLDLSICNGHLQPRATTLAGANSIDIIATGEAFGARQFNHIVVFAAALPRIVGASKRHRARPGLPREKVLAAVIRLIEQTLTRIGNLEYARENESFGLTTLRNRHVRINGEKSNWTSAPKATFAITVS